MNFQFSFEKLQVWQLSRKFSTEIYRISSLFPKDEIYGLTSQIWRAAISLTSNIAEGSTRISSLEQARFTEIAYGSLLEILNQLIIASDLNYISEKVVNEQRVTIEQLSNMLNKLRQSQINRKITNKQINK